MSGKERKQRNEPIPLPAGAVAVVEDAQRKLAEINAQVNSYAAGLRHGLGVPEGWTLDMKLKAFVPPAQKKKEDAPAEPVRAPGA